MSKHVTRWITPALSLFVCLNLPPVDANAQAELPPDVILQEVGHGWLLRDAEGMSLYVTDRDFKPSESTCKEECAEQWPPLIAGDDATGGGEWTIVAREDGSRQWAFRGKPLYRYSGDAAAGDTFGDGLQNVWHIAMKPIETPTRVDIRRIMLGHVLVEADTQRTLYIHDDDAPENPACSAECARTWTPLKAPLMASGRNDWSVITRDDGTRQWAYKGKPLYNFAGDLNPGEALGHQEEGKWRAAILEPRPPLPDWVTVQGSDTGYILADEEGKTLYGRTTSRLRNPPSEIHALRQQIEDECGVECPGSPWIPVIASADDRSLANWTLVARDDGKQQWAFKGEPLYTNELDEIPGALHGIRSGDRSWHALMLSGEQMQGTGN